MKQKPKKRWVPKVDDYYWWVFVSLGRTEVLRSLRYPFETSAELKINCFRTKTEAQAAAKAITKILRGE